MYEDEEEESQQSEDEDGPNAGDEMDLYMQQHPELLLALDIAAFRRQQAEQRMQANGQPSQEAQDSTLFPRTEPLFQISEEPAAG